MDDISRKSDGSLTHRSMEVRNPILIQHRASSPQLRSNNAYDPIMEHLISKETRILLREGFSDGELVSLVRSNNYTVIRELHHSKKITKSHMEVIIRASCIYDTHLLIPLFQDEIQRDHIIECLKNNSINTFAMFIKLKVHIEKEDMLKYGTKETFSLFPESSKFNEFDLVLIAEYGNIKGYHWLRELIPVPSACGLVADGKVIEWICKYGPFHPLLGNRIIDSIGSLDLCIILHKHSNIPVFDKDSLIIATRKGNLKILKWLHRIGILISDDKVSLVALKHGHTRILIWLKMMNLPISSNIKITEKSSIKTKGKDSGWSKSWSM